MLRLRSVCLISALGLAAGCSSSGGSGNPSPDAASNGADAGSAQNSDGGPGGGRDGGPNTMQDGGGGSQDTGGPPADAGTPDSGAANAPMGAVDLPSNGRPVTLSDLRYSTNLHKMIAPGATTGNVVIIDPDSLAQTVISGFGNAHSADEGRGLIYVVDRNRKIIFVADPSTKSIIGQASTMTTPDYVRWVESANEVWVTEAISGAIEVFAVPAGGQRDPQSQGQIMVPDGVEGIAIDNMTKKAYVHLPNSMPSGQVGEIDVMMHMPTGAKFYVGCSPFHGNPIVDEARQILYASCGQARVVDLDIANQGAQLGNFALNDGTPSILAYNPTLSHVYLRGDPGIEVDMIGVGMAGSLMMLEMVVTPNEGSCMAADDRGYLWVCDTVHARLLRFHDTHPATPH